MNITKIFETQRALDAHINAKHPVYEGENRLSKKVLALLVELSECANEWRKFKFWSNDQEPRNKSVACHNCKGKGKFATDLWNSKHEPCLHCEGTGLQQKNPLLEEYVDCLHLIVSIGIELNINPNELFVSTAKQDDDIDLFISLYHDISQLDLKCKGTHYKYTFVRFSELGACLGFTKFEIESAYYSKNKTNHERQESNY